MSWIRLALCIWLVVAVPARALERPDKTFKVYQFPANLIPRIDGKADDWVMVPDDYVIGADMLSDADGHHPDPANLSVRIKVGWVKGENRLYFLYEAVDDYWDFGQPGMHNDTFELAVDGDRSGGPFIARFHPDIAPLPAKGQAAPANPPVPPDAGYLSGQDAWFGFQGKQAQNYHIFTPARDKDWAMAWGPQAWWIKKMPWSNIAYQYDFKPGQPGKLTMEFWITPFDLASADGPEKSIASTLSVDQIIGLAWAIIDYDGPQTRASHFWNLSPQHTMYGQASQLCAFRLMPLDARYRKAIDADWSFRIVDIDRRVVAFKDQSTGQVTGWTWDFGDGTTSTEQHPIHTYAQPGKFVVTLDVTGPQGTAKLAKVWDVSFSADPPK